MALRDLLNGVSGARYIPPPGMAGSRALGVDYASEGPSGTGRWLSVRVVQRALHVAALALGTRSPGAIDGRWGPATEAAFSSFLDNRARDVGNTMSEFHVPAHALQPPSQVCKVREGCQQPGLQGDAVKVNDHLAVDLTDMAAHYRPSTMGVELPGDSNPVVVNPGGSPAAPAPRPAAPLAMAPRARWPWWVWVLLGLSSVGAGYGIWYWYKRRGR